MIAAAVLASAASALVLFAPLQGQASRTVTTRAEGAVIEHTTRSSGNLLTDQRGPTLRVVGVALLLVAVPLLLNRTRLARPSRAVSAALLVLGSLLAGFSVGLLYLPSALAMTVAAALAEGPGIDGYP